MESSRFFTNKHAVMAIAGILSVLTVTGCAEQELSPGLSVDSYEDEYIEPDSADDNTLGSNNIISSEDTDVADAVLDDDPRPLSSKIYSDEELCLMARLYYEARTCNRPIKAEIDSISGDIVTIHVCCPLIDNGETGDLYEVDRVTGKGVDLVRGEDVDLTSTVGPSSRGIPGSNSDNAAVVKDGVYVTDPYCQLPIT